MDSIEEHGFGPFGRIGFGLKYFADFIEHLPRVEGAAIDAKKRGFGGSGQPMDQAGVYALASAAFADQQNRDIRTGDFRCKYVK